MTYASINEVWGGNSGNNQLSTSLENTRHPIHQQQVERKQQEERYPEPRVHTNADLYQCKYGSHDCEQIFQQNKMYNDQQKKVAEGMQQYPQQAQLPHDYTYLPQYPWGQNARNGYMMYGPQISQMWYDNPYQYNPDVANQIRMQQMYGGITPSAPTGPYQPQGYGPMPPRYNVNPPMGQRRENFTDGRNDAIKAGMIYFIFFLVALAVILCIFMICIVSNSNK
jgi:hypothetical protein